MQRAFGSDVAALQAAVDADTLEVPATMTIPALRAAPELWRIAGG